MYVRQSRKIFYLTLLIGLIAILVSCGKQNDMSQGKEEKTASPIGSMTAEENGADDYYLSKTYQNKRYSSESTY